MGDIDKVHGVLPAFQPVQGSQQAGDRRQRQQQTRREAGEDVLELNNEEESIAADGQSKPGTEGPNESLDLAV